MRWWPFKSPDWRGCPSKCWRGWTGRGVEHIEISSMYFRYFVIISPWKRAEAYILTLNPLYPRILCFKFGWNWPSGSEGEDFLICLCIFHNFLIISPWKRARPFIWTNLNPLHPRMHCAMFCWNWPVVLEKKIFFKIRQCIFAFL